MMQLATGRNRDIYEAVKKFIPSNKLVRELVVHWWIEDSGTTNGTMHVTHIAPSAIGDSLLEAQEYDIVLTRKEATELWNTLCEIMELPTMAQDLTLHIYAEKAVEMECRSFVPLRTVRQIA